MTVLTGRLIHMCTGLIILVCNTWPVVMIGSWLARSTRLSGSLPELMNLPNLVMLWVLSCFTVLSCLANRTVPDSRFSGFMPQSLASSTSLKFLWVHWYLRITYTSIYVAEWHRLAEWVVPFHLPLEPGPVCISLHLVLYNLIAARLMSACRSTTAFRIIKSRVRQLVEIKRVATIRHGWV